MTTDCYRRTLHQTFAAYRREVVPDEPQVFEGRPDNSTAPTVFRPEHKLRNVLIPTDASDQQREEIRSAIPKAGLHRWFASMASSQALCHSVFGSLKAMGKIEALAGIPTEDGLPAFFVSANEISLPEFEHPVNTLSEPRPTSIDAFSQAHPELPWRLNSPKRNSARVPDPASPRKIRLSRGISATEL
jgi:hypothetical protein